MFSGEGSRRTPVPRARLANACGGAEGSAESALARPARPQGTAQRRRCAVKHLGHTVLEQAGAGTLPFQGG